MPDNPYLNAQSVEELREMERALFDETHPDGKLVHGGEEYYQAQMELFETAFATLFPDDYDYHRKGRQSIG